MDELAKFWETIDETKKTKETQLERYIRNGANEHILKFIILGGGSALGSTGEKFSKFKFNKLKDRIKGDTSHDHTIIINKKIVKIEQKTSTLNDAGDFMWQHIAEKHPWDILLLMGIHYNEIKFYGMNKDTFKKLVNEGKITNQGSKNKDSEQGMWFRYSNVKNDIITIKTNEDIINLLDNDDNKEDNYEPEENISKSSNVSNKSKSSTEKIIIENETIKVNKKNISIKKVK